MTLPIRVRLRGALGASAIASVLFAGGASANMTVAPMKLSMGGLGNAPGVVRVNSKSEETQYIKVYAKRVFDPAMPQEREEAIASWEGKALAVSPAKFTLSPGASRAVRIISLASPEKEEVYRVYFESVDPPKDDDDAPNVKGAKVSVSVVWGALVRVSPAQPKPSFRRVGSTIENTGNSRIVVLAAGHCETDSNDSCTWQNIEQSIFPGGTLTLPEQTRSGTSVRVKFSADGLQGAQFKDLASGG